MKENYYKKFIRFLKEHNLYDAEALEYLRNNGVFFDFLEEENRDYLVHLYENMAEPKAVVAVGACACSGGIFEGCGDVLCGADQVLPVDLYVPGCAARPEIRAWGCPDASRVTETSWTLTPSPKPQPSALSTASRAAKRQA